MSERIRLFVFGLGYSAGRFASAMSAGSEWIGGTVRTVERAVTSAADRRLRPFVFDGTSPGVGMAEALRVATHVVVSVPPGEAGDPVLAQHRATLMAAPRLGVTVTMVAVVAGQLVVGALVDRFGWLDVPARHLSAGRITAILLIVVALVLLIRES